MTHLILVGGGHAHLFVLRQFARPRPAHLEVTLIDPGVWAVYSGMVPGWMAGQYRLEEGRIDLRVLAARGGVRFIPQAAAGLDAQRREIALADGRRLHYDLLSLDVGSETDTASLSALGDRLIPVKPLAGFQAAWPRVVKAAEENPAHRLAVVGGGAAGVELAMAARTALARVNRAAQVTLVAGKSGLLPTHGASVRRRVGRALDRMGIAVVQQDGTGVQDGVVLDEGSRIEADHVIASTGARAPAWLASTGLRLDSRGFVAVDATQQSVSHTTVFAAGDAASREGSRVTRSGVHAVRSGPVLAYNLLAALDGRALRPFMPGRRSLYLLSNGDGRAIASWGSLSAEGAWVWWLKDAIDRRFIRKFTDPGDGTTPESRTSAMNPTPPMRETSLTKRLILLLVVVGLVAAYFAAGLDHSLSFQGIKSALEGLRGWREASPLSLAAAFFSLYVLLTALSIPEEAMLLSLAGGALFGVFWGTILVSFASSIGALAAFLLSRHVLKDALLARFSERLKTLNDGLARDGAMFLFTLRLVPVVPFVLINLLMGLTPMRARTFYLVSQAGMLGGTILYVNAGTRLATLDSVSGILSPGLLASFALLGIFPWLAKAALSLRRRRQVYSRWRRPARFDRNVVVIGAGAGGLVTAYIGAAVKARVTLIEAGKMGGDCLNYGCVPSKALIKSAKLAQQMRHANQYGLEASSPAFSFREVMARVHNVIRTVAPHDSVERYTQLGVEVLQGYARIVDPWTVEVSLNDGGSRRLTSRSIVIAAGAAPFVPPLPGIDESGYVTSDTLWDEFAKLDKAPRRLLVLGGGPIGCELAQAMARLGSQVTQVQMGPRLLPREDEEVSALTRASMEADGVNVRTNHKALRCEREGAERYLVVEHEGKTERLPFDALVLAVGRSARLKGYGLEDLGIPTDRTIVTNEYLETLYPNIYAAGDVAGPYQFTHTAAHQAWYAAVNALFGDFKKFKADYRVIPWTTFVDPEVARVGLNEAEAKERGIPYEVTRYSLDELDRAIADSATQGFIKVLTPPGKDRILGVTIVGEHGGDLLAEFVLAMKWGLGLNKILSTIHTYPTLSEANKYTAGEWKRAHAPQRVLAWLERFHTWRRG